VTTINCAQWTAPSFRLQDDPDYVPDDEDDDDEAEDEDEDEDGEDDDEDVETWQVGTPSVCLTSDNELPRLAPICQLSQLETRPASPPTYVTSSGS
jgi:hypothetical protein